MIIPFKQIEQEQEENEDFEETYVSVPKKDNDELLKIKEALDDINNKSTSIK